MSDALRFDSRSGAFFIPPFSNILPQVLFLAFWGTVAVICFSIFLGGRPADHAGKVYLIGLLGAWRYLWQLTHFIRSQIYRKTVWPAIRKEMDRHPDPYPRRLYFLIPSYGEKVSTTKKMLHAVISEALALSDQVRMTLVISLASEQERNLVRNFLAQYPGAVEKLKVVLMHQQDGKRQAIGNGLRAIARDFNDPLGWHPEAHDDVVIMMDGDTVLEPGFLQKTLAIFKVRKDVAAVTPNNSVISPAPDSLMHLWYQLKFCQRDFMFSSHSLSERVLTLTGRLSMYRAGHIMNDEFIGAVESDFVDHWIFGRYPFLMGDDKSTWYTLLKRGHKMMYIPDAHIECYEDRTDHFLQTTNSLFSRWYANMLNNNGRAVAVGPKKTGFFIWWCLVDQKLTCWTPLIGPVSIAILAASNSPLYLAYYAGWVILTRSLYLLFLTRFGLELQLMHLPLLIYNQWYGAFVKLLTLSRRDLQSWRAKDPRLMKKADNSALREELSFKTFRQIARYGQLAASFGLLFLISFLLIFGVHIPDSLMLYHRIQTKPDTASVEHTENAKAGLWRMAHAPIQNSSQ